MRFMVLGFVAVTTFILSPSASAQQYPYSYRWCAEVGFGGQGGQNCGFNTYGQCLADIQGFGPAATCRPNPWYRGPQGQRHRVY